MIDLTTRQQEILTFIEHYEWRNGYWPSIREIQEKFNFKSTNAVMGHLRALERKEVIERIYLGKPVLFALTAPTLQRFLRTPLKSSTSQ